MALRIFFRSFLDSSIVRTSYVYSTLHTAAEIGPVVEESLNLESPQQLQHSLKKSWIRPLHWNRGLEQEGRPANVFDETFEDLSHIGPPLKPSFNFAAYADRSEVIRELAKLGVRFYRFEAMKKLPVFILRLSMDDVRSCIKYGVGVGWCENLAPLPLFVTSHIPGAMVSMVAPKKFLVDHGLPPNLLGRFISKNPKILKQNLEDLEIRINYLKSKKFTDEDIARIIRKNPYWLLFSTKHVDSKLGFFQKEFRLSGDEVRELVRYIPQIITFRKMDLMRKLFTFKEEFGFSPMEMKKILLKAGSLFGQVPQDDLVQRYEIMSHEMKYPNYILAHDPYGLMSRSTRIRQRHLFLKELGRDQYDPKLPNYVSPKRLVSGKDVDFCADVAKTTVEVYNNFLKTL